MRPRIEVFGSRWAAPRRAAEKIAEVLRKRGPRALVLASGMTMVPVYRELVRLHRNGRAPFGRVVTFNLDELLLPPEDLRSFRAFMERHLFSKVNLPSERIHFLRGDAADPVEESLRYEWEIGRTVLDLVLVGIGENGHVAYLEPARALPPRTSLVRLSASTRRGLAEDGMRPVPREALTMGIETILSAREILLVATGRDKAPAVAAAFQGPVTPACPASFLSLHPRLTVLLDRPAAARLRSKASSGKR